MKTLLERHFFDQDFSQPGLLTIPAPTGFGKTHQTCQFLAQNIERIVEQGIQVIFATPLLKNLPKESLKHAFENLNKQALFNEHFLLLENTTDAFLKGFSKVEDRIPQSLKQEESYQTLKAIIQTARSQTGKKSPSRKDLENLKTSEPFSKAEREFRRALIAKVFDDCSNKSQKLKRLQHSDYQWVKALYPATQFEEKAIIMMSMRKFVMPFSPLIEQTGPLIEKLGSAKQTVVILDEFDACKQDILSVIIDSGRKYSYNLEALLSSVHNHITNKKPSAIFLKDSDQRVQKINERDWKPIAQQFAFLKERLSELYQTYHLSFNLKTKGAESSRHFLFEDFGSVQIMDKYAYVVTDEEAGVNFIIPSESKTSLKKTKLTRLISDLQSNIRLLRRQITYFSRNYLENKNADNVSDMLIEHALKTVMSQLGISNKNNFYLRFFDASIQYEHNIRFKQTKLTSFQSFYDLGFSLYTLEDSPEHDTYTEIRHYAFYDTAESYLAYLAEKACVIGLSATANVETPLKNFDLSYLKHKLKGRFYSLNEEDNKRLADRFKQQIKNYHQVEIHVDTLPPNRDLQTALNNIFPNSPLADELYNFCSPLSDYIQQRYLNLFRCIQQFISKEDLYAFLALFSKGAKPGDEAFSQELIETVFQQASNQAANLHIKFLYSAPAEKYEADLKNIQQLLSEGDRVLVISTYQTLGAGQNLQYPIPKNRKVVKMADQSPITQMDFNGLYLDRISSLIPNAQTHSDFYQETQMIERIFKILSLFEAGDISDLDKNQLIKHAIQAIYQPKNKYYNKSLLCNRSYYNAVASMVMQAIGRLCRTPNKAQNIYLFFSHELLDSLKNADIANAQLFLPEFKAVLNYCQQTEQDGKMHQLAQQGANKNKKAFRTVQRLLRIFSQGTTQPYHIEQWQMLRQLALHTPNFTSIDEPWADNCYLELPEEQSDYFYQTDQDFKSVTIAFEQHAGLSSTQTTRIALEKLMRYPNLKAHFEKNDWQASLPPAKYWLVPILFNNIYKGALGEEIGRFIFEHAFNISLEEMPPEHYELFDFRLGEGIYIDFKFWANFQQEAEVYRTKIAHKLEQVKGQKAIIINVFPSEKTIQPIHADSHIIEIPCFIEIQNDKTMLSPSTLTVLKEFIK